MENVIERQVITANGRLDFDLVGRDTAGTKQALASDAPPRHSGAQVKTLQEMQKLEHDNLVRALVAAGGRVSGQDGAAALLGIKPTTLASRLKKSGINAASFKTTDAEAESRSR